MIATVQQNGNNVWVYNERGMVLFSRCGELVGYTSETVSVKLNTTIWTYDSKGKTLFGK